MWEVAAAGKPAILVPYPLATADHQTKNALFFERAGGAITVPETELGRVPDLARSLLGDADRLKEMGEAMRRVARPGAAEEIAEELIALARLTGGSGSSASAARACRGTQLSPRRGVPRWPAGTGTRRPISSTCGRRGFPSTVSEEPEAAPDGFEAVVSTAFAGQVPGLTRAEFLAELVSQQDSIVVAGAHGKTTTTGMIAFVLDRLGRDPAFLIGGEIPQLGGNARAGSGWLVVEGDESDRTIEQLRPKIAVVTNVDLDHHSEFASRAEVEQLFERWLAEVPQVVKADELAARRSRARRARGAQPAQRRRGARGPRARRRDPGGSAARSSRSSRARAGGSSSAARRAASRCSTTTRTIRPRSRRRSPRCATAAESSCSSSRTCTRGRDISPMSSVPPSPPPMSSR